VFLPRALQIALFAPFPSSWLSDFQFIRLVAMAEMVIAYPCLAGVVVLLARRRQTGILLAIYFCVSFMIVYGFVSANLGTLYRLRYVFLMIMMALGLLGWFEYLYRKPMSEN
jgi:hypothetical protein